jgi:hypothetical protein
MRTTWIFIVTSIVLTAYSLFSCDESKTLQERLQEEKRAISRYIDKNQLKILNEYPQNGVFAEKEFFKTSDGLYIHVVDSGNGQRAIPMVDDVTVRFDYRHNIAISDSSITQGIMIKPYDFIYGLYQSYSSSESLVCVGWVYPLAYVGENAKVDLIIPSSLGSYSDNNDINPVFYKGITYTNFY